MGIWATWYSIHNKNQARSSISEQLCFPLWWLVVSLWRQNCGVNGYSDNSFSLPLAPSHKVPEAPDAIDLASRVFAGELLNDSSSNWVAALSLFSTRLVFFVHSVLCNLATFLSHIQSGTFIRYYVSHVLFFYAKMIIHLKKSIAFS